MKNLVWQHNMDINEVFPQSYDLTDFESEEFKDFLSEFKFGQLIAFLKCALQMTTQNVGKPQNLERIIVCIGFIERRIKLMSDAIFDPNQNLFVPGQNNELDVITDDIYYSMLDTKSY